MPSRGSKVNCHILTRRELAILNLFAEGYRNREIADELCIDDRTVRKDRTNLTKKLNAANISSAIHYALVKGLISVYEVLERRFSKRKFEVRRISIADNR